jgi:hypothetical protein
MAAKHLFAASGLGVFEALADRPQTPEQLAARLGISRRTARISADAMVALGLIVAEGGRYQNGDLAQIYLAGQTPADLRPFLGFWDQISYQRWTALEGSLRRGAAEHAELSAAEGEIFAAGVEAITAGAAHALATAFSWAGHQRLLDVGGGTGSLLLAVLAEHPHMRGTVVEVEPVVSVARQRIAATPFAARAEVVDADALNDPLPEGHDALLVANLAHLLSPENNTRLLRRLRESAPAGARLLLVDFWTDPSHTDPPFAALMAGEFALFSDEGDVYSEEEVREWPAETGWAAVDRRPLAGPQSLILAEAN